MNLEIFNIITLLLLTFFPSTDNIVPTNNIDIPVFDFIDNAISNELTFDVRRRSSFSGSRSYKSSFSKPYKKKKSFDLDDMIEDHFEDDDDDNDFSLTFFMLIIFLLIVFFVIYSIRKK